MRVCLILTDIGFKLLFRKALDTNSHGSKVLEYFAWPKYDSDGRSIFPLYQNDDDAALEKVGRLIYELIMVSIKFDWRTATVETPRKLVTVWNKLRNTAEPISPVRKRRKIGRDTPRDDMECSVSFKFSIALQDGSQFPIEALAIKSKRILDAIFECEDTKDGEVDF